MDFKLEFGLGWLNGWMEENNGFREGKETGLLGVQD